MKVLFISSCALGFMWKHQTRLNYFISPHTVEFISIFIMPPLFICRILGRLYDGNSWSVPAHGVCAAHSSIRLLFKERMINWEKKWGTFSTDCNNRNGWQSYLDALSLYLCVQWSWSGQHSFITLKSSSSSAFKRKMVLAYGKKASQSWKMHLFIGLFTDLSY